MFIVLAWCLVMLGVGMLGVIMMICPTNQVTPYLITAFSGVVFGAWRLYGHPNGKWRFQLRRAFYIASYLLGALSWWWFGKEEGISDAGMSKAQFEQLYPQSLPTIYAYLLLVFAAGAAIGFVWKKYKVTEKIIQRLSPH